MKVTVKGKGETPDRVYEIGFGGSLEKITTQLGEEWVLKACMTAAAAEGAKVAKRYERAGMNAGQITEAMAEWYPGAEVKKVHNPVKGMVKKFSKLSDAEKEALKAALGL